jgi:nitric oxide reductase large subunit
MTCIITLSRQFYYVWAIKGINHSLKSMVKDQFWWWVVRLWVEGAWEVIAGALLTNRAGLYYTVAHAIFNFVGAGLLGVIPTLPQVNQWTHTQIAASCHPRMR